MEYNKDLRIQSSMRQSSFEGSIKDVFHKDDHMTHYNGSKNPIARRL